MIGSLDFGPFQVSVWYLANSVATATAGVLAVRRLIRGGYPARLVVEGATLTIVAGVAGVSAAYWLVGHLDGLLTTGSWQATVNGTTVFGALTCGAAAGMLYCRWRRLELGRVADLAVLPTPLGQAIGRIGCFLSGCCGGRVTDSWLGVALPDGAGLWARRYPTQLIAAAGDLLIFVVLLVVERAASRRAAAATSWPFPGFLALLYFVLYLGKRFAMEFIRVEPRWWGPLTWAHLASFAGLILFGSVMVYNLLRARARARGGR